MRKLIAFSMPVSMLAACSTIGQTGLPATLGEQASNYGYIPLDPLPVDQVDGADSCDRREPQAVSSGFSQWAPILEALPDLAIRFAVAEFSAGGELTFGPSKFTTKGKAYRAVLDYVNVDVIPVEFAVRKLVRITGEPDKWYPLSYVPDSKRVAGQGVVAYEARIIRAGLKDVDSTRSQTGSGINFSDPNTFERVTFPIYVGVGLRLSADIRALEGGINLSGLGTIGAQADAKNLTGTLTVQTLGVTGKAIATTLPLPSKLDQTTIENGILAIGTSRAVLYNTGTDQILASPRVVGLYSPVGSDPRLVNALYSELSGIRVPWARPCKTAISGR